MCRRGQVNIVDPELPSEMMTPQLDCQHLLVDFSQVLIFFVSDTFSTKHLISDDSIFSDILLAILIGYSKTYNLLDVSILKNCGVNCHCQNVFHY